MKKILIIEDEPDVAETMKMIVSAAGYKVEYVVDPEKGIKIAKKYDLILLDIIMPKMSGREVLAILKKHKIKTPVIIVSAIGLPIEVADEISVKYPDVGFVPKTSMHTVLVSEIKKKIGK